MVNATLLLPPVMLNLMSIMHGKMDIKEVLFTDVMDRYRSTGAHHTLPVSYTDDVINVTVSLQLKQLTSLDPDTGDAELEVLMGLAWRDRRLSWNPAQYEGTDELHVLNTYIWKPDIVLYNGHVTNNLHNHKSVVKYNGNVTIVTPISIESRCNLRNSSFVCGLKFGSWTYPCNKISPWIADRLDILSQYQPSESWEVVSVSTHRSPVDSVNCSESHSNLTFTFTFRPVEDNWWDMFG